MKKVVIITFILFCLFATSCDNMTDSEFDVPSIERSTNLIEYSTPTVSDNIDEIDLSLPENSSYLQYKKEFSYNNQYPLSDGRKIIEDKNLYIEELSGIRTPLIEVLEEETEMCVKFCNMIDDERFYYYIIYHESTAGTGVYNLSTGEDYRIDGNLIPIKVIKNYLWFENSVIDSLYGFSKLNLDDYTYTEIDLPDQWYMNACDLSPDGTKVAVYGKSSENSDRQILIYSLDNKKVLESYTLPRYVYKIIYNTDKQVFALSYYDDKRPAYEEHQGYLYIVDLE